MMFAIESLTPSTAVSVCINRFRNQTEPDAAALCATVFSCGSLYSTTKIAAEYF